VSTAISIAYLVSAVCFILGIKRLGSPKTAPGGNLIAAIGMAIAIVVTLLHQDVVSYTGIAIGVIVGSIIGVFTAQRVEMTAMPQMVAAFNGLGGAASALVAAAELVRLDMASTPPTIEVSVPIVLGTLIGAVTLSGSFIAFAKLQEIMDGRPIVFGGQQPLNALIGLAIVGLSAAVVIDPTSMGAFWLVAALALALGILLVIPIGGADMPVVISLLNSYSGLAACATGFVLGNQVLIISGSLVGASGIILTQIMCKAMNRSLFNVIFGAFGAAPEAIEAAGGERGPVKSGSADEAAMILDVARAVIIVPGYGLAVAQAQHAVRDLADELAKRGVDVRFAIHPVAGRMPGHMNVLLAEADVPYEQLVEMDEINPSFPRTDVALVLGANDVTNPDARENTASPIYGMPILEVDKAKTVMVCKRSLNPGFAGIDNPLYYLPQTMMLFGDAKAMVEQILAALKDV
jgi:NAD(P) transhydrogenase subunit beta